MRQTQDSIAQAAHSMVSCMGFIPQGYYWVGSEVHQYLFHTADEKTGYMLEFGGGDNPYLGCTGYRTPYVINEDMIDSGFEDEDEEPTKVWELDFEGDPPAAPVVEGGTPLIHVEGLSISNEREGEDMGDWNQLHLDMWAIGALALFINEIKTGVI